MKLRNPFFLSLLLVLGGCATQSPPADFFILTPQVAESRQHSALVVGVGPVNLAHYLDRRQIVSRSSEVQVQIDEFNRWAGDHGRNITRVLAQDLAQWLGSGSVLPYPWNAGLKLDYQLIIDIERFDLDADQQVVLEAQWELFDRRQGKLLRIQRSRILLPVPDSSVASRVEVQSRALVKLTETLAAAILNE